MRSNFPVPATVERGRIAVFLAVAFGVASLTALVVYLTGGLTDSPELLPGVPLWFVLVSGPMMFSPAIANVVTRLVTGEGWTDLRLRPRTEGTLRYYAAAWLLPAVLTVVGGGLYFALFPEQFDPSMTTFADQLDALGPDLDPRVVAAIQVVSALTIAPVVNAVFAFGEEFGWRGYLLPKLLPLGVRRAVVLHGLVWGAWHWPITALGYNYGFDYPGFPVAGMVAFLAFTVGAGTFLAWVTVREGSVWPASIGHGAVNAVAGITALVVAGQPNPLLGPTPIGVVAGLPWLVLAAYLLLDRNRLEPGARFEGDSESTTGVTGREA